MSAQTTFSRTLLERCTLDGRPLLSAARLGAALSVLSLVASFSVIGLLALVLPAHLHGASAAAAFENTPLAVFMLSAVVLVPFIETLIGQCLPIEPLRYLGAAPAVCTIAGAVVFSSGHYMNGGLMHGIGSFVAGLVFSYGYLLSRPRGWLAAITTAYAAHAVHNAVTMSIALLFPDL